MKTGLVGGEIYSYPLFVTFVICEPHVQIFGQYRRLLFEDRHCNALTFLNGYTPSYVKGKLQPRKRKRPNNQMIYWEQNEGDLSFTLFKK